MQSVFRFAPSPNGELHLGHAYSAMLNYDLARSIGGKFLIRIEDIDVVRCRREYEMQALDDLAWLGLRWETPIRRQSEHFEDYRRALEKLMARGLVYPAFMSRAEIRSQVEAREAVGGRWPRDPDGASLYPGLDRDLDLPAEEALMAEGRSYAFRLKMDAAVAEVGAALYWNEHGSEASCYVRVAAEPSLWGDVIVARKEIPTSYHLSVVVDDAAQGVTHVVRGEDLRPATAVHRLLQRLLKLPAPLYRHHRLILDDSGRKLSKTYRDTSLATLRKSGADPADIRHLVGLPQPPL